MTQEMQDALDALMDAYDLATHGYRDAMAWLGPDRDKILAATLKAQNDAAEAIHALLSAAVAEARAEEREANCLAVCWHCRRHAPLEESQAGGWRHFVNDGQQPKGELGRWVPCAARHIRKAAARTPGAAEGTR